MPTPTYIPLATVTLAASSPAVSFSSIVADYRDLIVVIEGGVVARTGAVINLNDDATSANYPAVWMRGSGSSGTSGTVTGQFAEQFENSTTNRTISILQIMDYSATDKHKTILVRTDNANPNGVEAVAMRWASTAVVNKVSLVYSGDWAATTTFTLYGIAG